VPGRQVSKSRFGVGTGVLFVEVGKQKLVVACPLGGQSTQLPATMLWLCAAQYQV
jgi:hypothetical protein